ncbi:hypothetical protein DFP72DRAFT_839948 [Ephemerocybe angulata]|uniref:Uncharacterized protein n=1 Tax=Ephemerocybe angulata TaxID=980116 RepID=A0A8H6MH94_9AGAR|nr:hypothetical protein DFP72DRAFT_839948 [Tulosesus angulatus]
MLVTCTSALHFTIPATTPTVTNPTLFNTNDGQWDLRAGHMSGICACQSCLPSLPCRRGCIESSRARGEDYPEPVMIPKMSSTIGAVKDAIKPDGDALRPDKTLRDVEEMEFLHSPFDTTKLYQSRCSSATATVVSSNEDTDTEAERKKQQGEESESKKCMSKKSQQRKQKHGETEHNKDDGLLKKSKPKNTADATKDLRLCGEYKTVIHYEGEKKIEVKGWYWGFCITSGMDKRDAFLTGNVSAQRRHLVRKHLDDYWQKCHNNNAEFKTPQGWEESGLTQQSITGFAVEKPATQPEVTKEGIREHLLAIVTTCDLPFCFIERPAVQVFIQYLNPQLSDTLIPKKTSLANAVLGKVAVLEERTMELIEVHQSGCYWLFGEQCVGTQEHMIKFNPTVGQHTGEMIGKDLLTMIQKFKLENKLRWMVGDRAVSYRFEGVLGVVFEHTAPTSIPTSNTIPNPDGRYPQPQPTPLGFVPPHPTQPAAAVAQPAHTIPGGFPYPPQFPGYVYHPQFGWIPQHAPQVPPPNASLYPSPPTTHVAPSPGSSASSPHQAQSSPQAQLSPQTQSSMQAQSSSAASSPTQSPVTAATAALPDTVPLSAPAANPAITSREIWEMQHRKATLEKQVDWLHLEVVERRKLLQVSSTILEEKGRQILGEIHAQWKDLRSEGRGALEGDESEESDEDSSSDNESRPREKHPSIAKLVNETFCLFLGVSRLSDKDSLPVIDENNPDYLTTLPFICGNDRIRQERFHWEKPCSYSPNNIALLRLVDHTKQHGHTNGFIGASTTSARLSEERMGSSARSQGNHSQRGMERIVNLENSLPADESAEHCSRTISTARRSSSELMSDDEDFYVTPEKIDGFISVLPVWSSQDLKDFFAAVDAIPDPSPKAQAQVRRCGTEHDMPLRATKKLEGRVHRWMVDDAWWAENKAQNDNPQCIVLPGDIEAATAVNEAKSKRKSKGSAGKGKRKKAKTN